MNKKQLKALRLFLATVDGDPVAQADLNSFGNAFDHLNELLLDTVADQCEFSLKDLYPAKK